MSIVLNVHVAVDEFKGQTYCFLCLQKYVTDAKRSRFNPSLLCCESSKHKIIAFPIKTRTKSRSKFYEIFR